MKLEAETAAQSAEQSLASGETSARRDTPQQLPRKPIS